MEEVIELSSDDSSGVVKIGNDYTDDDEEPLLDHYHFEKNVTEAMTSTQQSQVMVCVVLYQPYFA
jgi:hypothetical protein